MIQCQWCQAQNQPGTTSCQTCGAPLNERDKVSDSGWREAPRLRDMTEFRFSGSTCQVEGELVPVADVSGRGKADMVNNDALPDITVEPDTFTVRIDGEVIEGAPATELPMAQRYFLF